VLASFTSGLLIEPLPGNRVPRRNRSGRASFPGQAVFRRKFMATATQKKKVHKVMHEHKKGTLKSGSGKKVRSRKQAVAIAMSESGQSKKAS
jgi:Family of unknown function (DUF6496)